MRNQGSVPPDIKCALRRAITAEQLHWHEGEVEGLDVGGDVLRMRLTTGTVLEPRRVLLATGFTSARPGGALVDQLIASDSLPCARCGYPIVDESLRWHPRVYVSGPLAELELGPAARNIAGARRAGDHEHVAAALDGVQDKAGRVGAAVDRHKTGSPSLVSQPHDLRSSVGPRHGVRARACRSCGALDAILAIYQRSKTVRRRPS